MNFSNLADENAVINLIGKNTMFKFHFSCDGILTYKAIEPKEMNGNYYNITIDVFYEVLDDFFCYSKLKDTLYGKQLFEVYVTDLGGQSQCIYHDKYKGEN